MGSSFNPSVCQSISLLFYQSVDLSICLLSICLSIYLSQSINRLMCLSAVKSQHALVQRHHDSTSASRARNFVGWLEATGFTILDRSTPRISHLFLLRAFTLLPTATTFSIFRPSVQQLFGAISMQRATPSLCRPQRTVQNWILQHDGCSSSLSSRSACMPSPSHRW
jgi:hypothetical protein